MPRTKVTKTDRYPALVTMAGSFVKAGHEPENGLLRCRKCGTTLHDFLKRGRLPCLMTADPTTAD